MKTFKKKDTINKPLNENKDHSIHLLVQENQIDIISSLIKDNKINLDAVNANGLTLLQIAIQNNCIDIIKLFLELEQIELFFTKNNSEGKTLLHELVLMNNYEIVEKYVNKFLNSPLSYENKLKYFNYKDKNNKTALDYTEDSKIKALLENSPFCEKNAREITLLYNEDYNKKMENTDKQENKNNKLELFARAAHHDISCKKLAEQYEKKQQYTEAYFCYLGFYFLARDDKSAEIAYAKLQELSNYDNLLDLNDFNVSRLCKTHKLNNEVYRNKPDFLYRKARIEKLTQEKAVNTKRKQRYTIKLVETINTGMQLCEKKGFNSLNEKFKQLKLNNNTGEKKEKEKLNYKIYSENDATLFSKNIDCKINIAMIGDSYMGKSALLRRYTENTYKEEYILHLEDKTIKKKCLEIEGKKVQLEIHDFPSAFISTNAMSNLKNKISAFIFTFDITNKKSFEHVNDYHKMMINDDLNQIGILVATKMDLIAESVVSNEEAKKFAQDRGMSYIETSAKLNYNAEEVFVKVAKEVLIRRGVLDQPKQSRSAEKPDKESKCVIS